MRFGVLGPLQVWTRGGKSVRIPEVKVRALLADLLVNHGQTVSADRLIDDLWGGNLPANPAGVLRSKISQLRRVLREAESGGQDLVVSGPPGYGLRADAEVDAIEFQALVSRAREAGNPTTKAALLGDALALWRGAALADFRDETFTHPVVARLEEQRLAALEDQAETRLALGDHTLLVSELTDLMAQHPFRERFRAVHMRALYHSGRQSEALDSYHELRDRLLDTLGLDPGPELVALHQAILEQDPELTSAPSPSMAHHRTNLPSPLTDLIGRSEVVARTREVLMDRGRLVTLTGPGGVGKTRVAVAAADGLAGSFPDGVWLIDLAMLERANRPSTAQVAEVAATVLDVRDDIIPPPPSSGEPAPPTGRLMRALSGKRMLLVLDNCEHVIEPAAEFSQLLLQSAPNLRILATSQEPLGISGELVQAVPPLESPATAAWIEPEQLQQSSAARLFLARAAAATPGFTVDRNNGAAVAAICRRLDGIPLALEMAATRVRAMGVRQLAARLDDRFRLLASGTRGVPVRQQTLQAMIDWSWELLTEQERAVLRRLAVHSDGCTLAAAEEICAGDEVLGKEDVLDLLVRLVGRSLVVVTDTADGPRYRLLESVAAYCQQRLKEAGESETVQQWHYRYYTALAQQADQHLRGASQRRWLRRLDAETANLRAALQGAVRHQDAVNALRLTCSLAWYWVLRGRLGEGRQSLATALAVPGEAPAVIRTTAMTWQAGIGALGGEPRDPAVEQSRSALQLSDEDDTTGLIRAEGLLAVSMPKDPDIPASEDPVKKALASFQALGDSWATAAALSALAWDALQRSDLAAVKRDAEQSLALFREVGDHWGMLHATDPLAALATITGDYAQATRLRRESLRIGEELGLWPEVSVQLNELGRLALLAGDYAEADELHERARQLAADQSNKAVEQFAEVGLAVGARRQGKLALAEKYLRPWLDWNRLAGWDAGIASILAELGFIAEQRGDAKAALALHRDGYAAARTTSDARAIALALEGLAGAQALAGHYDHAARLLGAAATARESVGAPLPHAERRDVDRATQATQAALGDAFGTEFERGAQLDPDECVKLTTVTHS